MYALFKLHGSVIECEQDVVALLDLVKLAHW